MKTYRLAGKTYNVPDKQADELTQYVSFMSPQIPKKLVIYDDAGTTRKVPVPSNLRALSFSVLLSDYAEEHWKEYVVTGESEVLQTN